MNPSPSRYADWKAPSEDGQHLLWPDAGDILRQSRENQARLSTSGALIQNVPLAELRRRMRAWIGHTDPQVPLIASGHQAELYHPGVWVKDVLANALARRLDAQPFHFAIDTDSPKHLHLRWPGASMPLTDDPRLHTAAWTGLLDGPTPAHLNLVEKSFKEGRLGWDFEPMAESFLESLRPMAMQQTPLAAQLTDAIHQLNWSLGLRHHALLVAPLWTSTEYLVFVYHILARADQFADQYNAALAAYRSEQGIVAPGRPMPDLHLAPDRVEAPFWFDDLGGGTRRRLELVRTADGWALDDFVFDPAADGDTAAARLLAHLRQRNLRLAPRALTLTLFLRLFVADQFIHGIGGGRYDQVTDRLIHSHFGIEPPAFCVTTVTLYFPGAQGQKRVNLLPLLQEGRRIRHGSFWQEKRDLAARIASLPRRSRQRRDLYYQMHDRLADAVSSRMHDWSARLDNATRQQTRQKTLFDRELFFALQPEERLRQTITHYARQFQ